MPFKTVWTDEKLIAEANKYNTRQEFRKGSQSAYVTARKKGNEYCDNICSHMKESTSKKKWTIETLSKLALNYTNRADFRKHHYGAHNAAQKLGILHIIYAHMARNGGFDINAPAIMYYLKINSGEAYKIGVTNTTVELRFKAVDLKKIETIKVWEFETGREALDSELSIKKEFHYARYEGKDILINGNTELFTHDILLLDN